MGDDGCNGECSNYRCQRKAWNCYYCPINSYQTGRQSCEQTVNHSARINLYNRHAAGLTYQSGITHFHLQGSRYLSYVMHAFMAL
jgi:hypothetical protein